MIDGARFGNDEPHPTLYSLAIVFGKPWLRHTVVAPLPLHTRHYKAVWQGHALNRKGCKQRGQIKRRHGVIR